MLICFEVLATDNNSALSRLWFSLENSLKIVVFLVCFWPDSSKTKSRCYTVIKTVLTESYQAMKHIYVFNSELPS